MSHWLGAVAATGVILAAIYLLWSYQRMAYGPVHEEHRGLPDVTPGVRLPTCLRTVVEGQTVYSQQGNHHEEVNR